MSEFEVIALGVGDTFSEIHRPTALLLISDGFHLAIDCPDMYRAVLRDAGQRAGRVFDFSQIDHFLITHVHGDHMNGLEGVTFFKHFVEKKHVQLFSVPEVRDVIWSERLKGSMGQLWNGTEFYSLSFEDYFAYTPLEWASVTTIGPFNIQVRRTKHHIPTCAVRIEANGRIFGYSCDTAFDPELIQFLEPADLIIHETNLGPAHSPYASLAGLPEELRQRMRLIHYPDGFDSKTSAIQVAHEGEVFHV
jgi:ribonuclease BN (tRNA processing enzyme)